MTTNGYQLTESLLNEIEVPEVGMVSHTLFNDDDLKIVLFGFAAGHELTAHKAPMPATIQILRGEATVTLESETHSVGAGCLIHMRPNLLHGIVATTPLLMLLTLVKAARTSAPSKAA
jgi:quercetin dioxygenase-like cupin family protein